MNSAVKSAVRVLDLLEFFSVSEDPMGVSELSRLMLIPKSSMQALLGTLVARGYLERVPGGYQMSTQQKEQGWVGGALARLRKVADPVMADLVAKTGESVFLSVLAPNHEMKFIAKAISHNLVRYDAPLSNTRPAYRVSSGVCWLAALPEPDLESYLASVTFERSTSRTVGTVKALQALIEKTREQGWLEMYDTNVDGAFGVSALIRDESRQPVAALTLAGPTHRLPRGAKSLHHLVEEAAGDLSERIALPQRRAA